MKHNILLIDDSPTDAAILVAAFEEIGYAGSILVAHNGIEAIDILDDISHHNPTEWPQLILLDLNLPRKTGLEVLDDIKTNPAWKSIPTVILSSSSSANDVSSSYQRHANAYIAKPRQLEHYEMIAKQLYSFWLDSAELPSS